MPNNGYLANEGEIPGWKCNRGFRASNNKCVQINIPEHAYLANSKYGSGWECERGYRNIEGKCNYIKILDNAHLDHDGKRWVCNKPYKKIGDICLE